MTLKGKVLAGSRGDHYLLCFRGDQCVCKPLLHLLYFNGFESQNQAGLRREAERRQRADLLPWEEERSIEFAVFPRRTDGAGTRGGGRERGDATQISTIDSAGSLQCISLLSPLWSRTKRGGVAKTGSSAARQDSRLLSQPMSGLCFESKALGQLPSAPDIPPEFSPLCPESSSKG